MMLDAERMIEAERVAQLQLAPQLLVALMRRHSGLGPDMGEVGEFHAAIPGLNCSAACSVAGGMMHTGCEAAMLKAALRAASGVHAEPLWSRGNLKRMNIGDTDARLSRRIVLSGPIL
jgi:hypothetical protein